MCAFTRERREDEIGGRRPRLLLVVFEHQRHVIVVSDGDIADAFHDRFDLCAVISLGFARQVGFNAPEPIGCFCLAVMADIGSEQRDVIGMVALAGAYLAAPFRIGKLFIGRDLALTDALLGGVDQCGRAGSARTTSHFHRDIRLERIFRAWLS